MVAGKCFVGQMKKGGAWWRHFACVSFEGFEEDFTGLLKDIEDR